MSINTLNLSDQSADPLIEPIYGLNIALALCHKCKCLLDAGCTIHEYGAPRNLVREYHFQKYDYDPALVHMLDQFMIPLQDAETPYIVYMDKSGERGLILGKMVYGNPPRPAAAENKTAVTAIHQEINSNAS